MVYPYNGILFSNKKGVSINIWNNIDESQSNYAERKKPGQQRVHASVPTVWFCLPKILENAN